MLKFITPPISRPEITGFLVQRGWNLQSIGLDGWAASRPSGTCVAEYLEVFPLMRGYLPSIGLVQHIACRSSLGYKVAVTDSLRAFQAWYIAAGFKMVAADMREVLCSK